MTNHVVRLYTAYFDLAWKHAVPAPAVDREGSGDPRLVELLELGLKDEAIARYLGVSLQPLDENIAASLGLPKDQGELVRSTVPGQAAARAGIQQGDVILRVNGQPANLDQTVSYLIANTTVGSRVPVDIIRDGRRHTVQVVVGQRPDDLLTAAEVVVDGLLADAGAPGHRLDRGGQATLGHHLRGGVEDGLRLAHIDLAQRPRHATTAASVRGLHRRLGGSGPHAQFRRPLGLAQQRQRRRHEAS